MNKNPTVTNNQKGQVAVEYILLTVVMAGLAIAAHNYISSTNMLGGYVQKPWQLISSMIETGVWGEARVARTQHPGKLYRHLSLEGEPE